MKTTDDTTINILFSTGFFWIDYLLFMSILFSFLVICCLGTCVTTIVYCVPHYLEDEIPTHRAVEVNDNAIKDAVARVLTSALTKKDEDIV